MIHTFKAKHILLLLLLSLFYSVPAFSTSRIDSILSVLDWEIENRETYYQSKEARIRDLKEQMVHFTNLQIKFDFCDKLYNEYLTYQFDSAFVYSNRSLQLARELKNPTAEALAGCNVLHCYISAGLFKESWDMMNAIELDSATVETKGFYYTLCRRLTADMRAYAYDTPYADEYYRQYENYSDSALTYLKPGTYEHDKSIAMKMADDGVPYKRLDMYFTMLDTYNDIPGEKAKLAYDIGTLYEAIGETEQAIYYLALSSIYDIRYCVRETVAKRELAKLLLARGDVIRASNYIRIALEEANSYNARHRQIGINSVLPIVEQQRMEIIEKQKHNLVFLLTVVSLLVTLLAFALMVIYKQVKKLSSAKHSIQEQFNEISAINEKLGQSYAQLEETNTKLEEANEIKDQYIIQSIYGKSEYLDKVEGLLLKLDRKLKARQYEDIYKLRKEFNIKTERENVFSSFDQAFLKLFPNFITDYNQFFLPKDRTELDAEGELTPELRIFALIRLGVTESERIARFLNLSVKTIYSYKGKAKAKAIIPKEEFEYRVMQIKKKN